MTFFMPFFSTSYRWCFWISGFGGTLEKFPATSSSRTKGEIAGYLPSGSKGTPRSKRRKFGLLSAFLDELREGDLDPASNKEVSHLARCFYYSTENVTSRLLKR